MAARFTLHFEATPRPETPISCGSLCGKIWGQLTNGGRNGHRNARNESDEPVASGSDSDDDDENFAADMSDQYVDRLWALVDGKFAWPLKNEDKLDGRAALKIVKDAGRGVRFALRELTTILRKTQADLADIDELSQLVANGRNYVQAAQTDASFMEFAKSQLQDIDLEVMLKHA